MTPTGEAKPGGQVAAVTTVGAVGSKRQLALVLVTINGFRTGMWGNLAGAWTFVVVIFPPIAIALLVNVILLARPTPSTIASVAG